MGTQENQGSEPLVDANSGRSRGTGAKGVASVTADTKTISGLTEALDKLTASFTKLAPAAKNAIDAMKGTGGAIKGAVRDATGGSGATGGGSGTVRASMASSLAAIPSRGGGMRGGGGAGGIPGAGGGAAGGAGGSGLFSAAKGVSDAVMAPAKDLMRNVSARIDRGADYSLQADRMSVQLQQMYGMSNKEVRQNLRMPLTSHYLLGGGTAVNDLLGMQASTGLSAAKQASTVESFRAISGFSMGSQDATKMLTTMASPDVANRMFMMGGTGMYGIGGKQKTGMQTVQDIVRNTGLTNPGALKGALQQGSNTRQRLTAMGVPQDMQDMVIQYATQNATYQKKTSDKGVMYDPSVEADRKTMGIEGSYAVQHEKTTGERLKREEKFYGRQVDNFADFERNLRTATKALAGLEDTLSGIIGLGISSKGHPVTEMGKAGFNYYQGIQNATANFAVQAAETGAGAVVPGIPGGDATVGNSPTIKYSAPTSGSSTGTDSPKKLSKTNEQKLATLDPKLATPLRRMLEANSKLEIGDARRSSEQQERSFRARYTPRPDLKEKTQTNDRIWNGVVWVHDNHAAPKGSPAMAAPGQSWHEKGLAADVIGDDSWIIAHAHEYSLGHGGTGTGGLDDEPFHIQNTSTMGRTAGGGGEEPVKGSKGTATGTPDTSGTVSASSATGSRSVKKASVTAVRSSGGGYSGTNAGEMAAAAAKAGLAATTGSIIGTINKASELSAGGSAVSKAVSRSNAKGGDSTVGGSTVSSSMSSPSSMSGGMMQITISPTIYLSGTQDSMGDMRRVAKEVGSLLEHEVRLATMRAS